ncbi:MAG: gas vesicle protein [Nitrospirae bacterium]|nr:gas vesicle protein [Nitrospirota bacterium]
MAKHLTSDQESISLCETLDRVLNKGVVIRGEVMITVADVDLIYLDLGLLLTSIETAMITGAIVPGMKSQGLMKGNGRGSDVVGKPCGDRAGT